MINLREILRRLLKYLILVISVCFFTFTELKNKVNAKQICSIGIIAGTTYCILDLMSPTINLTVNETCGVNNPN